MDAPSVTDFLPIPDTTAPVTEPEYTPLTDSHVLAQVARQVETCTGAEVSDLGWNEQPDEVENPLVAGLDNEDLWLLIRRFNQVRSFCSSSTAP